jgi:hypothetical protein
LVLTLIESTLRCWTKVTFVWSPPDDGGSPITSYTVQRATNSTFTSGLVTITGITGTSTVITGLTNGVQYFFRIAAINAVATAAGTQPTPDPGWLIVLVSSLQRDSEGLTA